VGTGQGGSRWVKTGQEWVWTWFRTSHDSHETSGHREETVSYLLCTTMAAFGMPVVPDV